MHSTKLDHLFEQIISLVAADESRQGTT